VIDAGEQPVTGPSLDDTQVRRARPRPRGKVVAPRTEHPVKDIVLPLAVVIGLIGNAWWGGVGWGKVSTQLELLIKTQAAMVATVNGLEKEVLSLQSRLKAQEEGFRLFKAYTKGRIARLPYRASDDGE
jgi:hypothetical protein